MYEAMTPEKIKAEILAQMTEVSTDEGSFADLLTAPVAYELDGMYHVLDAMVPIAFVDETSGEYIDMRAAEYGLTRKSGMRAGVTLALTGKKGLALPAGQQFCTEDNLIFQTTESAALTADGTVTVQAVAEDVGAKYNIGAGEIVRPVTNVSKLDTVTNDAAATGGMDGEQDAALFSRLANYRKRPATSGNAAHYERWALDCDGIGKAKCIPVWDGPGTVKVIVADLETRPVTEAVRAACAAYIEQERPIGAEVTVVSAEAVAVTVSATVSLTGKVTPDVFTAAFRAALQAYIDEIAFDGVALSYNRVAYLLMGTEGINDYTALTVNGGTENVPLTQGQVPLLGEVLVHAS